MPKKKHKPSIHDLRLKTIELVDGRTSVAYRVFILDTRSTFGDLQIKVREFGRWFEPTAEELKTVNENPCKI